MSKKTDIIRFLTIQALDFKRHSREHKSFMEIINFIKGLDESEIHKWEFEEVKKFNETNF